jgi:hypothetical protein
MTDMLEKLREGAEKLKEENAKALGPIRHDGTATRWTRVGDTTTTTTTTTTTKKTEQGLQALPRHKSLAKNPKHALE